MKDEIYVLFGIDTETDIGSYTPFYEGVKQGVPKLVDIFKNNDIKTTFFFTGECAKENAYILHRVQEYGHEIGVHSLYHETVGDALFPIPGEKPLLIEEVPLRLKTATQWVQNVSGEKPRSWRCPKLWGSTAIVNALENLGYIVDASYPMYFYGKQIMPYHPNRNDWREKGDLKILEIPAFANVSMESNDEWGLDRDQWPLFRTIGAQAFFDGHITSFINTVKTKNLPVVLTFYIHPWEFIPCKAVNHFGIGGSFVDEFVIKNTGDVALNELDKLIKLLKNCGAKFMRMDDFVVEWESVSSGLKM